jgi:hypothetical protein
MHNIIDVSVSKSPAPHSQHWVYDDGGRAAAGYKGEAGDCVCRAIAIATETPYQQIYGVLWALLASYADSHRDRVAKRIQRGKGRRGITPRDGISPKVYGPLIPISRLTSKPRWPRWKQLHQRPPRRTAVPVNKPRPIGARSPPIS